MTVRAATKGDAVAIADIRAAIVADPWITFTNMVLTPAVVAREIAEVQAQGHGYLVALDSAGHVAGFAYYKQFRSGPGYAHTMEHTIHLAEAARRQGLGRTLMAALEAQARAAGVHSLIAGIGGANPGALAFHQHLGFQVVGQMPQVGRKNRRWLDLILMQKIIGQA